MDIKSFVSKVVPSLERSSIRSTLLNAQEEFNHYNKPIFRDAAAKFGRLKFKSKWSEDFEKNLRTASKVRSNGNAIALIDAMNKDVSNLFDAASRLLDEYFGDDITADSITIPRYNLLQYVEALSFYTRYSRRWLALALTKENNLVHEIAENDSLIEYDLAWINENKSAFMAVCRILTSHGRDLESVLEKLPEITVTPDTIDFNKELRKEHDVDPMGFGFIRTTLNPAFYGRMFIAAYQVKRLRAANVEAEALQMRILALRAAIDGKPDAQKEARAKWLEEERLRPLLQEIKETEEEYNNA